MSSVVAAIARNGGAGPSSGIRERFERVDPAAYPHISALTDALFSGEGDDRFVFGLRLMIEGLRHVKPSAR